jgi:non-homologous end joining protein Ku
MHLLDKNCGSRVRNQRICPVCKVVVECDDLVRRLSRALNDQWACHPLDVLRERGNQLAQMPKAEGEKVPQREIDLADNLINKSWLKSLSGNSIRTNTGKTFLAMVDQKVNGERW